MEKELIIEKTKLASGMKVWRVTIFDDEQDVSVTIDCMTEIEANLIARAITDNSIDVIRKI